jgi:hypothetical protein
MPMLNRRAREWIQSMRLSPLALAAACVAGLATSTLAQTPSRPNGQLFISPTGQPFRAAPGAPYPVAAWFAQVDKRGEGRIDRAAFRADAEAFFDLLDKNHDRVIDPFELQAYEQDVVPEILGAYRIPEGRAADFPRGAGGEEPRRGLFGRVRQRPPNAGEASVLDGAAPYELIPDPEPVASADLAMDGRITLAEFLKAADRRFDRLDVKHSGFLLLAALPKTAAQKDAEQALRAANATRRRE